MQSFYAASVVFKVYKINIRVLTSGHWSVENNLVGVTIKKKKKELNFDLFFFGRELTATSASL